MKAFSLLLVVSLAVVATTGFVAPHIRPMSSADLTTFYRTISDLCGALTVASFLLIAVALWRAAE